MSIFLILSCEHGGNRVPAAYTALFESRRATQALAGHRGMDIGALPLAESLAVDLKAPLYASTVTRLLVDLNRSLGHRELFSEFSQSLDARARQRVIAELYEPHRSRVSREVAAAVAQGRRVCHVGVHSFAPRLRGLARTADIGLLYDPARPFERGLCGEWARLLRAADAGIRVRRNYPYRGAADGLTTHLRRTFGPAQYLGIELEANQALLRRAPHAAADLLAASLGRVLASDRTAGRYRSPPKIVT